MVGDFPQVGAYHLDFPLGDIYGIFVGRKWKPKIVIELQPRSKIFMMFNNYRPKPSNRNRHTSDIYNRKKKPVKPQPRLQTDRRYKKKSEKFTSRLALCLHYFKKKIFFSLLKVLST